MQATKNVQNKSNSQIENQRNFAVWIYFNGSRIKIVNSKNPETLTEICQPSLNEKDYLCP